MIGINAAVILSQKVTNGIGFAIPVTPHLRQTIDDLKQGREVVYGALGVHVTSLTPMERKEAGLSEDGGAKIDSVDANSPASAKLKVGDTVVNFNGQPVTDGDEFVRLVGEAQIDRPVTAIVYRGGKSMSISVATTRRQSPMAAVTRDTRACAGVECCSARFHNIGISARHISRLPACSSLPLMKNVRSPGEAWWKDR